MEACWALCITPGTQHGTSTFIELTFWLGVEREKDIQAILIQSDKENNVAVWNT